MGNYIACICEGGAERAILDMLLDNHKLIFEREDLIEEELLRYRKGEEFQNRYLRKGFSKKITVYRILDSHREKFKLSKAYEHKVDVINVVTAPEIEMLMIINEGKYADFKKEQNKSGIKPSDYGKEKIAKDIKTYKFVKSYFSDISVLIRAIREYSRISQRRKDEKMLVDLLK